MFRKINVKKITENILAAFKEVTVIAFKFQVELNLVSKGRNKM